MKPAVEEILTEMLMGHAPKGVSCKYVLGDDRRQERSIA
jgi:hypothetical protein